MQMNAQLNAKLKVTCPVLHVQLRRAARRAAHP
jgi:hypothetical protein